MHLARVQHGEDIFWCVGEADQTSARRISAAFSDWAPAVTAGAGLAALGCVDAPIPVEDLTFLAPHDPLARVVVAGANYSKHLTEFGVPQVSAPFAFLKANGALIGAHEDIRYPPLTEKLDYEVELVDIEPRRLTTV